MVIDLPPQHIRLARPCDEDLIKVPRDAYRLSAATYNALLVFAWRSTLQ
ncbi:hypothetical protein OMK73_08710 [Cupriavidus sp. D39]|nr:hypothetical protein [Cupriavidus sp. D39]MCY0853864.1 hypothetical protein [Cupriavidus sp. D39]